MFDRNVKIVACSSSRYNGDASAWIVVVVIWIEISSVSKKIWK